MVLVILVETTTPLEKIIQISFSILDDLSSDVDISSEGALLVDVRSINSSLWGLESQTNALVVSHALAGLLSKNSLPADEDAVLLLVGLFGLHTFVRLHCIKLQPIT